MLEFCMSAIDTVGRMKERFHAQTVPKRQFAESSWQLGREMAGRRATQIADVRADFENEKTQALSELAAIVAPINSTRREPSEQTTFDGFVQQVCLPFYRRKWKRLTAMTNEDRIARYLTSELGPRSLGSF